MNNFFFNLRLFNGKTLPSNKLHQYFLNQYNKLKLRSLNNSIQEIFEFKDKSKYISSSLVQKDIVEVQTVDCFKENYNYTVSVGY